MSFAPKVRDANEPEIIAALEAIGAKVVPLEPSEPGLPDLLIGWRNQTFLQEVKNPEGRNRLDPAQVTFHRLWPGAPIGVVKTPAESLAHIGAIK
jgi:hypothetical protein